MNLFKDREQYDIHDLVDTVVRGHLCRRICCTSLVNEIVEEPVRPNSKDLIRVKLKHVRKSFRRNSEGHWEDDLGECTDLTTT